MARKGESVRKGGDGRQKNGGCASKTKKQTKQKQKAERLELKLRRAEKWVACVWVGRRPLSWKMTVQHLMTL